jgi:dynein heavy chain 1
MERSHDKMKDPLFRFLEREVNIAGQLLTAIRKQLKDLHSMCLGNINATNLLKTLALDLHAEQVPKQWHKFQFQQQISANEWLIDFKKRID